MALRITILKSGVEVEVRHTLSAFKLKEYNNALSESSALESDFSIGIKIPVEGNELVFDMKHLDGVIDRTFAYSARFYAKDGRMYNGALYLENVVEEDDHLFFDTNYVNSTYNSLVDGKTLRDLDDTVLVNQNGNATPHVEFNAVVFQNWPEALYFLPMMHHRTLGKKAFNVWNQNTGVFEANTGQEDLYHIVPQVYMLEVLKRCFTTFGYTVSGSVWTDEHMKQLLVGGLRSFTQIGVKYMAHYRMNNLLIVDNTVTPGLQTPMVMDEAIYDFNTAPSTLPSATPYDPQVVDTYKYSIVLKFGDVVSPWLAVLSQNGSELGFINDPVANSTYSFTVIAVNSPTNMGIRLVATFGHACHILPGSAFKVYPQQNETAPEEYGFWMRELNLTECLPDISITDFLLAVKRLGLRIDINNNARHAEVGWSDELLDEDSVEVVGSKARTLSTNNGRKLVLEYTNEKFDDKGFETVEVAKLSDVQIVVGEPANFYVLQTNTWYQYNGGTTLTFEAGDIAGVGKTSLSYGTGDEEVLSMGAKLLPMTVVEVLPNQESLCPWVVDDLKHKKFNEPSTEGWDLFWLYKRVDAGSTGQGYPFGSTTRFNYYMGDYGNDLLLQADQRSIVHVRWQRWLKALSRNELLKLMVMNEPGKYGALATDLLRINNLLYMTKTRSTDLENGEVMEVEALRL